MIALLLAAEAPNSFFIPGDVKEFYWGSAAFLVVMALLWWKLLPVIKRGLSNRTKRIADQLAAAERVQAEADAELAEQKAKFANYEEEAAAIVADARAQAEKLKVDLAEKTEVDIVTARERADVEIAALRERASSDVEAEFNSRTVAAIEAVVRDNLDDDAQQALIEQYIHQVGTS